MYRTLSFFIVIRMITTAPQRGHEQFDTLLNWVRTQISGKARTLLKCVSVQLATCWEELTHWKRLRHWERLKAGGEGDERG